MEKSNEILIKVVDNVYICKNRFCYKIGCKIGKSMKYELFFYKWNSLISHFKNKEYFGKKSYHKMKYLLLKNEDIYKDHLLKI